MSRSSLIIRVAGILQMLAVTTLAIAPFIGVLRQFTGSTFLQPLAILLEPLSTILLLFLLLIVPLLPLIAVVGFGFLLSTNEPEWRLKSIRPRSWLVLAALLAIGAPISALLVALNFGGVGTEAAFFWIVAWFLLLWWLSLVITGFVVRAAKPLPRFNSLPLISSILTMFELLLFVAGFVSFSVVGLMLGFLTIGAFGLCWLLVGWQLFQAGRQIAGDKGGIRIENYEGSA